MPTMKAAVFVEKGRIVPEEKPIPDVGPLDALIRITTTTICGTDVHTGFVTSLGRDSAGLLIVRMVFSLVLSWFVETFSVMLGTIPIVFPIVTAYGIDPVRFGIVLVMGGMALITPPVGMNLLIRACAARARSPT